MSDKIISMIADQLGLDKNCISPESRFAEDLYADSLDVIELLTAIEDEFGLDQIPEENLAAMKTVADLISYCENNS